LRGGNFQESKKKKRRENELKENMNRSKKSRKASEKEINARFIRSDGEKKSRSSFYCQQRGEGGETGKKKGGGETGKECRKRGKRWGGPTGTKENTVGEEKGSLGGRSGDGSV